MAIDQAAQQLIGRSEALRVLEEEIGYAARSTAKVLITGESGVGKELVARLIHQQSTISSFPLVTVNCAAIPEPLLESELFGHHRGSFTGAYRDKPGLLQVADGGTVFLDEIGEMSARMQALLLRFLESGELQPVGAVSPVACRVNVRVICATNKDLLQRVEENEFRADLYYRLNVIHLAVPALRQRPEDIPVLMGYFLDSYGERYKRDVVLSPGAMQRLVNHTWPGNVRELMNLAERLVVRSGPDVVDIIDLPREVLAGSARVGEAVAQPTKAEALINRMLIQGESFWSAVHDPFMKRDLTRDDLRLIVQEGLKTTLGNYRVLIDLFNMPPRDYRRFLNFLRKYECHQPFQKFRSAKAHPAQDDETTRPAEQSRAV